MASSVSVYLAALAAMAAAVFVRALLTPLFGADYPFVTLFPGVAVAAWIGGIRPAMFASLVGFVCAAYFFVPPRGTWHIHGSTEVVALLVYLVSSSIIALFAGRLRSAHLARQRSERRYRKLVECSSDTVWTWNPSSGQGDTEALLTWWRDLTGQRLTTPWDSAWLDVVHPDDRDAVSMAWGRALEQQSRYEVDFRVRTRQGTWRDIAARCVPLFDSRGGLVEWVGTLRDETDRKTAAEQQRQVGVQLQAVMDAVPAHVARLSHEFRYLWANRSYAERFGYAPEQVIGRHISEVLGQEIMPQLQPHLERVQKGETTDFELSIPSRQRGLRWLHAVYAPMRNSLQQPDGFVVAVLDVTRRHEAEQALREAERRLRSSEQQLRLIVSAVPALISYIDRDFRYRLANLSYQHWFGLSPDEIAGRTVSEVLGEDAWRTVQPYMQRALQGEQVTYEDQLPYQSSGPRWVRVSYTPDFNASSEVEGFVVLVTDITSHKQSEQRLVEKGARLRAALEASAMGTFRWDFASDELIWDDQLAQLFGLPSSSSAATLKQFLELVHAEDQVAVRQQYEQCRVQGLDFEMEFRVLCPDGCERWLYERGKVLQRSDGSRYMTGACVDITARKTAERERELLQLQQEQLLGELLRERRRLQILSRAAQQVNRVLDFRAILSSLVQLAMELVDAEAGAAGACQQQRITYHEYHRESKIIPVQWTFDEGDPYGLASWTLRTGEAYVTNQAVRDSVIPPGLRTEFGIRSAVCVPIYGPQRELLGCLELHNQREGGFTDDDLDKLQGLAASAAVAIENASLLERIRESDRRKDEFLAMLAHELRNPLAPIKSSVAVLQMLSPRDDQIEWAHSVIDRQVDHLSRLIDDLLDVSRINQGKIALRLEPLELRRLLEASAASARPMLQAKRHSLEVQLPPEALYVEGDETRLEQVLGNLLSNAAKYTPPGGSIRLSAQRCGQRACFSVADNGRGVAPEAMPRLFDLFFQVDQGLAHTEGGLGIGLTMVKQIVAMHGGSIDVRSGGLGQGTEFLVYLPLADQVAPQPTPSPVDSQAEAHGKTILVVDDNRDSALSLALLMRAIGHHVVVAHDGYEALEAARASPPQFALLDIGLPGMDGYQLAKQLREQFGPDLRLIAVSGYGQAEDRQRSAAAGFDQHLVKPVSFAMLQQAMTSSSQAAEWARGITPAPET